MDKPGSRRQAKRLPLIIERPDLTHPLRRMVAVVATTMAWGLWIGMWIPFLAELGRYLGYEMPEKTFPSHISLDSFLALARVTPYVLAAAVLLVLAGFLAEKLKARSTKKIERWRPVGLEGLASGAALNPARLEEWQSTRILYVEHGPRGRVIGACSTEKCDQP